MKKGIHGYLAACHHIYFIIYYMYISSLANKIVVDGS